MGLFSGILAGLGGVVGDIIGASSNAKSIKKASAAQQAALNAGIQTQKDNVALATKNYGPYQEAGGDALSQIMQILGLGGGSGLGAGARTADQQQQGAIDQLKASPLFTSQYDTGVDTILQNGAATGGLRGGNIQSSLAQFGSGLLSNVIQNQLSNLGGLTAGGLNAVGGITNASTGAANQVTGLQGQIGNAQAGSILGQQGVYNNLSSSLQKLITSFIPGGGGLTGGAAGF